MKQIHFILKVCIIRYFIAVQMPRKYDQKETEKQIKILNEELQAGNLNHEEQRELIRNLPKIGINTRKMEEHLAKGTSV